VEAFQGLEIPLHHRGSRLLGLSSFISALCTGVRGWVFCELRLDVRTVAQWSHDERRVSLRRGQRTLRGLSVCRGGSSPCTAERVPL
jgi:hypothetical protein